MKFVSPLNQAVATTRKALRNRIDSFLDHRNNYFSCFYPGCKSPVASFVLDKTFSRIRFDHKKMEKLRKLNEKGIIVYSGKYKTRFEFLYFHWALKRAGLPYPEIGLDIGFLFLTPLKRLIQTFVSQMDHFLHTFKLKDPYDSGYISTELSKGRSGFLYLIESKAFYRQFLKSKPDPLLILIELQKQQSTPIFFVPQTIVFSATPIRRTPTLFDIFLGSNEKPGKIRRLIALAKSPKNISVEVSDPVNLKEFLDRPDIRMLSSEFQVQPLRNHLTDLTNRQKRCVTGPVLKTRDELFQDILTDKNLQEFMKDHAISKEERLVNTRKRATAYLTEIAASYNLNTIYMFAKVLTWTFNNIFEGLVVDQDGLDKIKEASKKATLILVPCHKSHLDYLLLSYLMFKNAMPCPHIAAGKNLSFWPLGPIFRGGGAFFLRRTFKGTVLYSKIFSAYIEKLISEGFNLEFFIEGGRSRTGKLLSPKLGFLSMLLKAQQSKTCDDLLFVPIYVGYDRVLEEDAYLHEIEGGKKNPENLSQLFRARKFLKKKYGKVYINFDEPISLKDYIEESGFGHRELDDAEHKQICQGMGYKLINSINSISIVTPHGIIASCILNSPGNRFSYKDLMFRVDAYMNLLTFFGAELADTLTIDPDLAFNHVVQSFLSRKFIELADESDTDINETTRFIVKDNKRPILEYYKNNAISFFVPAAYTAIAILRTDTFQFSSQDLAATYGFLQDLFVDEFSFDEEKSCEDHINHCLKAFMDDGIIVPNQALPDAFNMTSEGFRKLKLFSSLLNPFLESYKVALVFFETYPKDKFDAKERIKKIQSMGVKMYKRQDIVLKESLSKVNYVNACTCFTNKGIEGSENMEQIETFKKVIDQFLELAAVNRP